jgi:glycosyltransferase involved in cell wall biosynthesis
MRIVVEFYISNNDNNSCFVSPYAKSLAKAIIRNSGVHEVILALSARQPEMVDLIRDEFCEILSHEHIRVLDLYSLMNCHEEKPGWCEESAKDIRESFLSSLRPDLVYITGLLNDYGHSAIVSVDRLCPNICTVVALSDLAEKKAQNLDISAECGEEKIIDVLKSATLCHVIPPLNIKQASDKYGVQPHQECQGRLDIDFSGHENEFDAEALLLLNEFERAYDENIIKSESKVEKGDLKPLKLALVSPFPPARSGISYYCVDLLSELSRYYDIYIVTDQDTLEIPDSKLSHPAITIDWFMTHADDFDRVLYHFGNSPFHVHMFDMLDKASGAVVLHDYFICDLLRYKDEVEFSADSGLRHDIGVARELYHSHGYGALQSYFAANSEADYPCNLSVLQKAKGVIVHSDAAQKLANQYNSKTLNDKFKVIPLLRSPAEKTDKTEARRSLNLQADDFVVCSFGHISPHKLHHRLLAAWLTATKRIEKNCVLVFVGDNDDNEYGRRVTESIEKNGFKSSIRITGWTDAKVYISYLSAADVGVQLRFKSRGETSAAVLDCMNYELPVIVNDEGSITDFPDDAVFKVAQNFDDVELSDAITIFAQDSEKRSLFGQRAKQLVLDQHTPQHCASEYFKTIETFYQNALFSSKSALVKSIAHRKDGSLSNQECINLAKSISNSIPTDLRSKQLFIDVTEICQNDLKTGIQRVVRGIAIELIRNPPAEFRVEPIYLTDENGRWHFKYANLKTLEMLELPVDWDNYENNYCSEEEVEIIAGDVYLGLDFSTRFVLEAMEYLKDIRRRGVKIKYVVYDLLPVLMPNKFPKDSAPAHTLWLRNICQFDGVVCISRSVADEFAQWQTSQNINLNRRFAVDWFHLGADIDSSAPTKGLPVDKMSTLSVLKSSPTFLMVGTIEPRKGHAQALAAFEILWKKSLSFNLVIVGKEGWMVERFMKKLIRNKKMNKTLFFMESISDEYLQEVYAASTCLIAASEGEGFGLPLIEAAQQQLPIIARDISVFREVAGDHAYYFSGKKPSVLAAAIQDWIKLYQSNTHSKSNSIPFSTWKQSAVQLSDAVGLKDRETHKSD